MIGIIGLGWLGLPLAKELQKKGYRVKGSTTSTDKMELLQKQVSEVCFLKLENGYCIGDLSNFLSEVSVLVITLPPKYASPAFDFYLDHLRVLLEHTKKKGIQKLIFTSSTGVFKDTSPIAIYTETSKPVAHDQKSTVLIEAEKLIANQTTHTSVSIVRLGGLVGIDRQPAKYLSGKELKNPEAPINLVHLDDAVGIICAIINSSRPAHWYHAVYPLNETRQVYYCHKTETLNMPEPVIKEAATSFGKKVTSEFTQTDLNYTYKKRP